MTGALGVAAQAEAGAQSPLSPLPVGDDIPPLIEVEGLFVRQGKRRVLNDVSMVVRPGEIVTIVGPNGSGKTTLLRSIVGALRPEKGQVKRVPGLRMGYVPQRLHLDPTLPLSVRRLMSLPNRVPADQIDAALKAAGLPHLADRPVTALSGGQMQRVLLARALLNNPQVLLLDEPTQGLDQPGSAAFYQQIEDLRGSRGCAVVMVSHELHVVMSASDRVICLNGHVCCQGTPATVATAPEYRALFGAGTGGALALYRHEHNHVHGIDGTCQDHNHTSKDVPDGS